MLFFKTIESEWIKKISTLMVKICKQRYDDVMWRHSYFVKKSQTQCQTDSLRLKLKVVFCTSNGSGTTWNPGFGFFTRIPGFRVFYPKPGFRKGYVVEQGFSLSFFCKNLADLLKIFWIFWSYKILKILHQILQKVHNMKKILIGLVFYV